MSSLKPVIHGRDHLPGGADPIPITELQAVLFNAEEEWLQVGSVSISGISTTTLTWGHLAGTALLDLSTPTQPAVVTSGVYSVYATASAVDNATARNKFQFVGNVVQAAFTAAVHAQDAYSDVLTDLIESSLAMGGKMAATDSMLLQVFNQDTAARHFSCPTIRVVRTD